MLRPDIGDATAGPIPALGRVRTPSFRTLKVGSRTEDPRRRQSSRHAVGNVPHRLPKGINTRANRTFSRRSGLGTVITFFVATLIALGILVETTMLFQSRGMPMAQLAAAERACARQTYVSDRERCMREWLAAAHGDRLAERQWAHHLSMLEAPMQSKTLRFVRGLSCTYESRVVAP